MMKIPCNRVCPIFAALAALALPSSICLGQLIEKPRSKAVDNASTRIEALEKQAGELIRDSISVQGVVVDENDQPIANARVFLRDWTLIPNSEIDVPSEVIFHPQRNFSFAESKTDESGKFQFESIEVPPLHTVKHKDCRSVVAVVPDRAIAWFKLVDSQQSDPIRLIVRPGTTVEGMVRNSKGEPVPNAEIYVDEISDPQTRRYQSLDSPRQFVYRNSDLSPRTTTNDEGKFAISNLPFEQRIGLVVVHNDYVPEIVYAATTKERQPSIEEPTNNRGKLISRSYPVQFGPMLVELVQGHRIRGQLVYEDNKPASKQQFIVLLHPSNAKLNIRTDMEGRFETRRFHDPVARLFVEKPDDERYVQFDWFLRFDIVELEKRSVFAMPLAKTIQGTLKSEDSKPIVGANVVFVPELGTNTEFDRHTTTAKTNDAGEFKMQVSHDTGTLFAVGPKFGYELAPMGQVLAFQRGELTSPPEPSHRIETKHFSQAASNTGPRTAQFDLLANRAIGMTGRVIDEDGNAMGNAMIEPVDGLFEWNGPFQGLSRDKIKELFLTRSDEQGQFTISGIPRIPGVVFRVVDPDKRKVALIYVDTLPRLHGVDVQLTNGLTLHGKVTLDGIPKPDVRVSMNVIGEYKIDKGGRNTPEQFLWDEVQTNMDGEYQFTGVPAKPQYFVSATKGPTAITATSR